MTPTQPVAIILHGLLCDYPRLDGSLYPIVFIKNVFLTIVIHRVKRCFDFGVGALASFFCKLNAIAVLRRAKSGADTAGTSWCILETC